MILISFDWNVGWLEIVIKEERERPAGMKRTAELDFTDLFIQAMQC